MKATTLLKGFYLQLESKNERRVDNNPVLFAQGVANMVATVEAIAKLKPEIRRIRVKADEDPYDLNQYLVPKNFNTIINSASIYVNENATPFEPIITGTFDSSLTVTEYDKVTKSEKEVDIQGVVLTPAEFNRFFNKWNSNTFEFKKELVPVERRICTWMDVGAVLVDGMIVSINDQAYVNEFAAIALGLEVPSLVNATTADPDTKVTDQEVAEWLISN
jgi:hypothetical protein